MPRNAKSCEPEGPQDLTQRHSHTSTSTSRPPGEVWVEVGCHPCGLDDGGKPNWPALTVSGVTHSVGVRDGQVSPPSAALS
jgi:hypothetical protein